MIQHPDGVRQSVEESCEQVPLSLVQLFNLIVRVHALGHEGEARGKELVHGLAYYWLTGLHWRIWCPEEQTFSLLTKQQCTTWLTLLWNLGSQCILQISWFPPACCLDSNSQQRDFHATFYTGISLQCTKMRNIFVHAWCVIPWHRLRRWRTPCMPSPNPSLLSQSGSSWSLYTYNVQLWSD